MKNRSEQTQEMVTREAYNALQKDFDEFIYLVSHDLNAPLRHIRAFSQLLMERLQEHVGQDEKRFCDIVTQSVYKLEAMLDGLLTLSRINTTGKAFEPVDCNDLMNKLLTYDLAGLVKQSGALVEISDLPTIHGDAAQLTQLFTALIENAIKFQPLGQKPQVAITSTQLADGRWQIQVADNGIGVAPEYAEGIFEVFRTLHSEKEYDGIGMGLAHAMAIARRHQASLTCEARLPRGSYFNVTF